MLFWRTHPWLEYWLHMEALIALQLVEVGAPPCLQEASAVAVDQWHEVEYCMQ
jgi:hypothetical protein